MTEAKNDIYFVASLIEAAARKTHNSVSTIAKKMGEDGIRKTYANAKTSHCLPMDQNVDELVEKFGIVSGSYYPLAAKPKNIVYPSATQIGKNYANIVEATEPKESKYPEALVRVMESKVPQWMDNYKSAFFYSPADYMVYCYQMSFNSEE